MDGREAMAKLVHVQRLATTEDFFEHLFGVKKGETTNMATTFVQREGDNQVFKVGDRVFVPSNKRLRGTITKIGVFLDNGREIIELEALQHYEGPTSEEDAWERVTMDIAAKVHETIGPNGYQTCLYEKDRTRMRSEAYRVLGCVMNCNENHQALSNKLSGIIERAEKRYSK